MALMGVMTFFSTNIQARQGLFQSFETLLDIQSQNYQKKIESLGRQSSTLNNLSSADEVELDADFINTILFYSASRYTSLAFKDRCSFYDLYLAGHLKGPQGAIENFVVKFKSKKGEVQTALVNPQNFLEKVAFVQCPQSQKFSQYFEVKNLPQTVKTIFLKPPTNQEDCLEIHQKLLADPKTPYLCKMSDYIDAIPETQREIRTLSKSRYREIEALKRKLTLAQRYDQLLTQSSVDYLKHFCDNIEKPKRFCDDFFNVNFWKRIGSGEKSKKFIEHKCKDYLNRPTLTEKQYSKCIRDFSNDPNLCHYLNNSDQALAPRQSCSMQSFSLNQSRLNANYLDCPSRTGSEGITNLSRLILHFSPLKQESQASSCELETTHAFATFNHEASDGRFWGYKLCYDDKINREEVCLPAITGDYQESNYSMGKVVAKILAKNRGYNEANRCEVIDSKDYKPSMLRFKSGCFIILDPKSCYGTDCKFKTILDEREIDFIKIKSGSIFDYFPSNYIDENISQAKLFERYYKKSTRRILNVSFLKSIFKDQPKAIIHGVACAEDLLPSFFAKNLLHKCTILPFIVDGYVEDKGHLSLILRTAIDDVHSPRIISWSYVFSALKAYQELHPLELWGMYAIY
jgi:hypothetical protein